MERNSFVSSVHKLIAILMIDLEAAELQEAAGLEVCRTKEHNHSTSKHGGCTHPLGPQLGPCRRCWCWPGHDCTSFIFGGVYEVSDVSVHRWFGDPDHVVLILLPGPSRSCHRVTYPS